MGMSNIGYLAIGLFAIVAVVLALQSKMRAPIKGPNARAKKRNTSPNRAARTRNSYRATAIVGNESACDAVRAIENTRFLVLDKDIPAIPLLNCDANKCACTYAHYEDRRNVDGNRRGPVGLHSELHKYLGQSEQRFRRGRRVTDWA